MKRFKINSTKQFAKGLVGVSLCLMIILASAVAIVDPFFHYHRPLGFLQYNMYSVRYQNDGIVRNFDYDALITGTSITQNFATSQLDELFGTTSVKVPYSGGFFSEIDELVRQAIDHNPDLKMVFRGLDFSRIVGEDIPGNDEAFVRPTYLYNENPFDDVLYLLNKDVLIDGVIGDIKYTLEGNKTQTFDEYVSWAGMYDFGKEAMDREYDRPEPVPADQVRLYTASQREEVLENVRTNVIATAKENPHITFYYFIPPYSIYYYDKQNRLGTLEEYLDIYHDAMAEMAQVENIRLYSFLDMYDVVTNLDNYRDNSHYGQWINALMLEEMKNDNHRITSENLPGYYKEVKDFYMSYDYDFLWAT
ncbi:MAG: hypothetical protein K5773_02260 [Pseudobutyrivibrio sp.]|nr:hypothetical protein [Pseudobutyrivibrio sp.]